MVVTYINMEVGIVNVDAVNSLLEVHVGNAIVPDVVILNHAELGVGSNLLDQLRRSLNVVTGAGDGEASLDRAGLGVAADARDGVLLQVNATLAEARVRVGGSSLRVGVDGHEAGEAKNQGVSHREEEGEGLGQEQEMVMRD